MVAVEVNYAPNFRSLAVA